MSTSLIDSHCHLDRLDLAPYANGIVDVLAQAQAQGVSDVLCVCINWENFPAVLNLAQRHDHVYATVGVHPNDREGHEPSFDELMTAASLPDVIGIGETGLDYYRSEGDLGWQHERFRRHIQAARAAGKPLIVHSRDAQADTVRILREEGADSVGGIMHCFVDDWDTAAQALDLGFYISFSGIITFNNAVQVREVAARVPDNRLLVETDAPYLAPVPYRGKPNYPAYVRHVAERLAVVRGTTLEAIAALTSANFRHLFQLT
jgi:TatD DNase family protein